MAIVKRIFDFYIKASIHVAVSCYSLVLLTNFFFGIKQNQAAALFAFFGVIVAYNFVKYDTLARRQNRQLKVKIKAIVLLSFFSFIFGTYYLFQLQIKTQIIAIGFVILTLLYTLPFFPNRENARNWAGIKIYIVTLCWVGVSLVLPVINAEIPLTYYFYNKFIQQSLLIFVLILIFEIVDLKKDDSHLQTVPQQIGVKNTKILGCFLLVVFCLLGVFNVNNNLNIYYFLTPLQFFIAVVVGLFLYFSHENKSKYYTWFWVESVPILWWILIQLFS